MQHGCRAFPQRDAGGQPEVNRDEPDGCVYDFQLIFLSLFLFGLGGDPPGFLRCSTATEQQKFTMANDASCVEVLTLGVILRAKAGRPSTILSMIMV